MNDSDDFMSDIQEVVEGAPAPVTIPGDTTVVTTTEAPDTVEEVDKLLSANDTKRETLTVPPPKKETPAPTAEEKPVEPQPTQSPQPQPTPPSEEHHRDTRPYLDRFLGEDETGNLILADGTVIAAKGKAREYYEGVKREGRDTRDALRQMTVQHAELGKKFKELYANFEAVSTSEEVKSLSSRTGMSPAEINQAVETMKLLREKPLDGLKKLLTQARLNGIDVSSLGVHGGIDLSVIRDEIRQEFRRNQPNTTVVKTQEQLFQEAQTEVRDFLTRHPQAQEHFQVLTQAKQKFPNATLDQLWFAYQDHQQAKLAKQDEEAFKNRKPVETPRPAPKPQPRTLTRPSEIDYAKASLEEIAQSILKDMQP